MSCNTQPTPQAHPSEQLLNIKILKIKLLKHTHGYDIIFRK